MSFKTRNTLEQGTLVTLRCTDSVPTCSVWSSNGFQQKLVLNGAAEIRRDTCANGG